MTRAKLWVIDAKDNVATVTGGDLVADSRVPIVGAVSGELKISAPVPYGHKVALVDMATGTLVVKYGAVIGTMLCDVSTGGHVHVHNLESLRGRGDLA